MALGELFYEAKGRDIEAKEHLRPQLYWIWKFLNNHGRKISKVELEKALDESGVYSGRDVTSFTDYVTCKLLRDNWIVKKRVVKLQENTNMAAKPKPAPMPKGGGKGGKFPPKKGC